MAQTQESCMDVVKGFLSSSEWNSSESLERIRTSCLNVEPRCVQVVGDSMSSFDRSEADDFLPIVRGCAGTGKAQCYNDLLQTTPSSDRSSAAQVRELLKKCEPKP